jgi:hypothetical protein
MRICIRIQACSSHNKLNFICYFSCKWFFPRLKERSKMPNNVVSYPKHGFSFQSLRTRDPLAKCRTADF